MLTTSRKKVVGDSSGKTMVQKRRSGPGAVDRRRLDQRFRDRLQAGEEEQEVVADLLPHRGHDHQQHRLVAVEDPVPVDRPALQHVGHDADRGREQERPQHAGDRRRHRVGPDQQRLVGERAAHDAVGHGREQQRDGDAAARDQHAEQRRDLERLEVVAVREQRGEILEARRTASSGRRRPAAGTSTRPPAPPARRRTRCVTAICGATSAYGSHAERKTTRFSTVSAVTSLTSLLVRRLELAAGSRCRA